MELIARGCCGRSSACSCARVLDDEKNDALDAVIGVLGVLLGRLGGGVTIPDSEADSGLRAATLAAVGVLNGSNVKGGSRKDCKFFFEELCTSSCGS